jgi:predicted phosphohydrolase
MPHDEKIFRRELGRLKLSLDSIDPEAALRIVMTHFPPTDEAGRDTALTRLLEKVRADISVFGHLHNLALTRGKTWDFVKNGVRYVTGLDRAGAGVGAGVGAGAGLTSDS